MQDDPHGCSHEEPLPMDPVLRVEFDRRNNEWWAGEDGEPPFPHIQAHLTKCAEAFASGDSHELMHQWDHFVTEVREIDLQWRDSRMVIADGIMDDPTFGPLMKAHAEKVIEAAGITDLLKLLKAKGANIQIIDLSEVDTGDFPGQYL